MKITKKGVRRFIVKTLAIFFPFLFLVIAIMYCRTTYYDFPEGKPFTGDFLHNPYHNLPDSAYKANFHAHTKAWNEVTNGHSTEAEMYEGYRAMGYTSVGISNYHKISDYAKDKPGHVYIPVYEHGWNMMKAHYLPLDAKEVSFFDFPLLQAPSHRQSVINTISETGAIVCFAHPKFTFLESMGDMEYVVNYEFTEVLNHYRVSDEQWDMALSAGRLTWVMGNDDTHDLVNEPTYLIWNHIHAKEKTKEGLLNAMQSGQSYGIKSFDTKCDVQLKSLELTDEKTFEVIFSDTVNKIDFVGQNGEIKKVDASTNKSSYTFQPDDSYIRVVAHIDTADIYLNPIVRYDGENLVRAVDMEATPNFWKTWLFRILMGVLALALILLIRRIIIGKK